jgi:putative ABC transport system substrate-binding protein
MSKKNIVIILLVCLAGLAVIGALVFMGKQQVQPSPRVYKIGAVHAGGSYKNAVDGLKEGLKDFGWAEGKNISFVEVNTGGSTEEAQKAAQKFIQEKVDVIYSVSTPPTKAMKEGTADKGIPIVFNIVGDPIGAGFAKSYREPGGNLTGCSNFSAELSSKRLEIFKEAFAPKPETVLKFVTFYDPTNTFSQLSIKVAREAVVKLGGIKLEEVHVKTADELKNALAALKPGQYDGIFTTPDTIVISKIEMVTGIAAELKIPVMAHEDTLIQRGATITHGANFFDLGKQCSRVVNEVLEGGQPAHIPIEVPLKISLVINLKAAKEIGFNIPSELLAKADLIVQ